jgi:hypothetical protein
MKAIVIVPFLIATAPAEQRLSNFSHPKISLSFEFLYVFRLSGLLVNNVIFIVGPNRLGTGDMISFLINIDQCTSITKKYKTCIVK